MKFGEDVFVVSSFGGYSLNGVSNAELPNTVGGFTVVHTKVSEKVHIFEIQLAEDEKIVLKTFKDMVAVNLDQVHAHRLHASKGMLGNYNTSQMLARNGTVVIDNPNDFAADWQVKEGEEMLFQITRAPQHPSQCELPEASTTKRRLGETIALSTAEQACADWDVHFRASCVHDVMATGDLDLAAAGAFKITNIRLSLLWC